MIEEQKLLVEAINRANAATEKLEKKLNEKFVDFHLCLGKCIVQLDYSQDDASILIRFSDETYTHLKAEYLCDGDTWISNRVPDFVTAWHLKLIDDDACREVRESQRDLHILKKRLRVAEEIRKLYET